MARFSYRCAALLLLVGSLASAGVAAPQAAASAQSPLVVIRFYQPDVYYALQLHTAISKAVEAKPGVMIDVISLAPVTGDAAKDKQWQTTAGKNTRAVIAAMKEMGVPAERISVKGESRSGLTVDETQIFVR